ncbi:MAG: YjjG family noncanonical pyrimidine nucleotidase [Bacteroidales bacterium]
MYKYFLFDLDRTLWDFDKNSKSAIFKLIDKYSLSVLFGINDKEDFFAKYEVINHHLWNEYETGKITKEHLRSARFYTAFNNYLKEDFNTNANAINWSTKQLQNFADMFGESYLTQMAFETELEPHALELLTTLKKKDAKIAIVTNGFKEVQYRKLSNSKILQYTDAVIISEEVGFHKPNPIMFKKAIEAICPANEYNTNRIAIKKSTLMVGDDFANDIEGAQIFGIDQFYYNPNHKPCNGGPTYQSDNLLEILL